MNRGNKKDKSMRVVKGRHALQKGWNFWQNTSGEGYVDTAVKILMAVVIGGLVLAGLYAVFGDVVMPTLTQRLQEMFNYAG